MIWLSYAFFVCAYLSLGVLAIGRMMSLRKLADAFIIINMGAFAFVATTVAAFGPDPFAETIAVFVLLIWGAVAPLAIVGRPRPKRAL